MTSQKEQQTAECAKKNKKDSSEKGAQHLKSNQYYPLGLLASEKQ